MSTFSSRIMKAALLACSLCLCGAGARAQEPAATPTPQQQPAATQQPQLEEWGDTFDGEKLDETKWEPFSFEGGAAGKIQVKDGQLQMRGGGGSRAGVISRKEFTGD